MANGSGEDRISISHATLRAELAELELRLATRITEGLSQKADVSHVTSLELRLATLERDAVRQDDPLRRRMSELARGELPVAVRSATNDLIEAALVAHTDKGWTARERAFGVIAIIVAVLSLALATYVASANAGGRTPAPASAGALVATSEAP